MVPEGLDRFSANVIGVYKTAVSKKYLDALFS